MTKAEEAALKAYPECPCYNDLAQEFEDINGCYRDGFEVGYEQAEKDTIAKIRKQVEKWMPDNPEGDEYTSGERVAFRSVLHLLKEMEEEL